ncbi:Fur family transcriptional regulator [Candidatus Cyanaurora vandensis]|uniref:Fur family transcriptional regulator n=1 Tax=Candidatus Cyanaurora vandensis TaxID=2714958 RepID=UPI0025800EE8|nr:Fur family transcriptional regulator [Candidatus Cyanaurora vandensis]
MIEQPGLTMVATPRANLEAVLERCKHQGMRLSPQRRAILDLLCNSENHLSAGAIYQQLTQAGQPVGYSSVYQNLEALARKEFIEVLKDGSGNRYGWRPDSHHHFHCTRCGVILDVDLPDTVARFNEQIQGRVDRCRVDLYGVCAACEMP